MNSLETPTIGWIGTGRMGHAMVRRLLDSGRHVHVWNRTRAKAEDLTEHGATIVDAVADLADLDIVFTMVSADADLEDVTLGEGGLLQQSTFPRFLVDCSTVSSEASAQIRAGAAARGTQFLAAPVSGNAKVVKAGMLSVAASGSRDVFDAVKPVMLDFACAVTYVGEAEVARLVKLAHNIFLGVVIQSISEVVVLAQKGGVSRSALMEFMNASVLGSTFTGYKTPAIVNLDLAPSFTATLLRKDFDLGLAAARRLEVPLPIAAATHQQIQAMIGRGHGEEDFAALLVEQARNSGIELEPEGIEVGDGLTKKDPS
jgi:3-hydroxyisobutyrate dehydrogenase